MDLQKTLDEMREKFEATVAPEIKATMHKATEELAASGIMDNVLKVGDTLPAFTLRDEQEKEVSSIALLAEGPLVISFYRGVW